jgi:hypothetical protein
MIRATSVLTTITLAILMAACSRAPSPTPAPLPDTPPATAVASPTLVQAPDTSGTPTGVPGRFGTLPPGSALPGDEECAARVRRHPWEPRPENAAANRATPPLGYRLAPYEADAAPHADLLRQRVSGRFAGTTDEILQWAACKWGIDEDIVRAQAYQESEWRQAALGDVEDDPAHCAPGYQPPCPTSFGILQVRWYYYPGSFPHARDSTAFNVDVAYARWRACYEGDLWWLNNEERGREYAGGDAWGCVGVWYIGRWYTPLGVAYIERVQQRHRAQPWREWGHPGAATPAGTPFAP